MARYLSKAGSGNELPFNKIKPVYLNGFVRKFRTGSNIIPVPGTSLFFKLPDAFITPVGASNIELWDNATLSILRTFNASEDPYYYNQNNMNPLGLNAFYLDMSGAKPVLYAFSAGSVADKTASPTDSGYLYTHKLTADLSTPTVRLASPSGLPRQIGYAFRDGYTQASVGGVSTVGACFVFPDGSGKLVLRGVGSKNEGSAQITVNPTTGSFTVQGENWFGGAPAGHSAYYTTADGSLATGAIVMDAASLVAQGLATGSAACIDQLVTAGIHVDKVEFPEVPSFSFTRSCGCMPVLVGTDYVAMISAQSMEYHVANSEIALASSTLSTTRTRSESNLFRRADLDQMLKEIKEYCLTRVEG